MHIKQQQIEKLARVAIAKPLAWAIYGCGVIVVRLARAIVLGARRLMRGRKGVTWAK